MSNPTDKLKMALRNAQFETQRRVDQAGVRDKSGDDPVVYRVQRSKRYAKTTKDILIKELNKKRHLNELRRDMRDMRRGIEND